MAHPVIAVFASRTFWTWYLFAGAVMATVLASRVLHGLVELGAPTHGLPRDQWPAFSQMALLNGPAYVRLLGGLAVGAVIAVLAFHRTGWTRETRHWAILATGAAIVSVALMLFAGYLLGAYVLPQLKLASLSG